MNDNHRVAIVTGSDGGIGSSITAELHAAGYSIVAADRGASRSEKYARCATDERGIRILPVQVDLTDRGSAHRIADAALAAFGRIDVLVHCAGVLLDARIEAMTPSEFTHVMRVNLAGALRLTGACLPALRKSGSGRVISIASRAVLGSFGSSNYSAAKGGLLGLTRSLSLAEGPTGITTNAISPGYITTPMTTHLSDRAAASIPVRRAGIPADVARTVAFLASPDAGYITGQNLMICGGRSLMP